jgi:hypothetical protein
MAGLERREQRSHRFEGCHRLRTIFPVSGASNSGGRRERLRPPVQLQIRSHVSNLGERADGRPLRLSL